MKKINFSTLVMFVFALSIFSSCKKDEDTTPSKTDDVLELAIRKVKVGQESNFLTARTNFINLLTQQSGTSNDREYEMFFSYDASVDLTQNQVFVGMTQYENLDTYNAIGNAIGTSAEATAFFSTFDPLVFTVLKPLEEGTIVDASKLASTGQVLEIAVRDLSQYTDFNQSDYETKRDAFLAALGARPERVAEYQWVSATDANIVVGMTVYKSQADYTNLVSDTEFTNNQAVTDFLGAYPPNKGGGIHTVVK